MKARGSKGPVSAVSELRAVTRKLRVGDSLHVPFAKEHRCQGGKKKKRNDSPGGKNAR